MDLGSSSDNIPFVWHVFDGCFLIREDTRGGETGGTSFAWPRKVGHGSDGGGDSQTAMYGGSNAFTAAGFWGLTVTQWLLHNGGRGIEGRLWQWKRDPNGGRWPPLARAGREKWEREGGGGGYALGIMVTG